VLEVMASVRAESFAAAALDPTRAIRPPSFGGRREEFEAWAFQFEAYCGLLGWSVPVEAAIHRAGEDTPLNVADQGEEVRRQSSVLYHLLVTLVRGPALSLIKLTPRGEGLEAIRRIYREYRPQIEEDFAEQLGKILKPEWWAAPERAGQLFTDVLTQWDEMIGYYMLESREEVSERTRVATILAHAPADVKRFLVTLPKETKASHVRLRAAIREHVLGRSPVDRVPAAYGGAASSTLSGSVPMEVDAVQQGWGKGERKPCFNCGKPGHTKAECWAKGGGAQAAGKAGGKSAGKGKGPGRATARTRARAPETRSRASATSAA